MPIMAADAQSDARGAAWLLASAAIKCINAPDAAPRCRDTLNNTYRLLEAFRRNAFWALSPQRDLHHMSGDVDTWLMSPVPNRHLPEIIEAMEKALASSFKSDPRDEAIEKIAKVLRALADPEKHRASNEEIGQTSTFFDELLKRLSAA